MADLALGALAATATASATAAAASTAAALALAFGCSVVSLLFVLFLVERDLDRVFRLLFLDRGDFGPRRCNRPRPGAFDAHPSAFEAFFDDDLDRNPVALLDVRKLGPLLVEDINGSFPAGAQADPFAAAACRLVFDHAKGRQASRRRGAHQARAVAVRARLGRSFEDAGAQPLAAHLHEAEARDAPNLDPGAIVLQRLLHRLLDLPHMARLLHVDEVDDDESRHVAKPQLPRDLAGRLDVGA